MTACIKLVRVLQGASRRKQQDHCHPCVYFSRNLDTAKYPVLMARQERCGLGFLPGDGGCTEMRTDNCSAGKR